MSITKLFGSYGFNTQLDSFNDSYEHKINNGISLFKKNLKNE